MQSDFKRLRLKQLDRSVEAFRAARDVARPPKGWLRAVREALGISAGELAGVLGVSRHLPLQLERSEAEDTITLKSLKKVASAMDCDVVYALVPRFKTGLRTGAGTLQELADMRSRARIDAEARKTVAGVEHSMALEDQAVGRMGEAVDAERSRLMRKRAAR